MGMLVLNKTNEDKGASIHFYMYSYLLLTAE